MSIRAGKNRNKKFDDALVGLTSGTLAAGAWTESLDLSWSVIRDDLGTWTVSSKDHFYVPDDAIYFRYTVAVTNLATGDGTETRIRARVNGSNSSPVVYQSEYAAAGSHRRVLLVTPWIACEAGDEIGFQIRTNSTTDETVASTGGWQQIEYIRTSLDR